VHVAEPLIQSVSDTAFWVAHYRAMENARPDALFRDPLAGVLSGERGRKIAKSMPGSFMTVWAIVIRTCIIDDYLRFAIASGVDTVLNLGAGLDTRPYRMELPDTLTWVEADCSEIIELKETKLAKEKPKCNLKRVKIDLADANARREMLARIQARAKSILILTEGVVPYLTVEDVGSLADDLLALPKARYWIVDYFSPRVLKFRQRMQQRRLQNAPFKFKPDDWFAFFEKHGWRRKDIRYLVEEGERLHRPMRLPVPMRLLLGLRSVFSSKEGRAALRQGVGYALLER
jgi:methyltransferase (TIGR00027 family)